jgi:hypothetical protein
MQNNDTAELALSQARQHFRHLKLDLPAKLVRELDEVDKTTSAGVTYDPAAVRRAVLAALAAGADPAQDEAVRTALTGEHLHALRVDTMIAGERAARRAATIRKHTDALIEAMRPVVEAADAALVAVRRELPNVTLTDRTAVSVVPPSLMATWAEAHTAISTLSRVSAVWELAGASAGRTLDHRRKALGLADLDPAELAALPTNVPIGQALALAGHRLSLATLDEHAARCARMSQAAAETQEQREIEGRTGVRAVG